MDRTKLIGATTFAALLLMLTPAFAQGFLMTEAEKEAIREEIELFIKNNPKLLVDTVKKYSEEQAASRREPEDAVIENLPEGLATEGIAPFIGNPDATVTVVEFFDYNCGFCKRVVNDVSELVEVEDDVKVVFREMPILGDSSQIAARYALAASKQGKYVEFHNALMKYSGRIDEDVIMRITDELGLDKDKLFEDVNSPDVTETLSTNMLFARELGVRGTPFFMVGNRPVPGAAGLPRLRALVRQARRDATAGMNEDVNEVE